MPLFRGFFGLWAIGEMVVFCVVWAWLGFLSTVGLLLLSFIVGVVVIRWQGLELLRKVQQSMAHQQKLPTELQDHLSILLGGFFLMIPGFLSSIFGLILIIPILQHRPLRWLMAHGILNIVNPVHPEHQGNTQPVQKTQVRGQVIEGEFKREDEHQ